MPRIAHLAVATGVALAAAPAIAVEPLDAGWSEIAEARSEDCRMTVTGNGQVYRIAASGLAPGATGRFVITNGDMKPIDWTVRADASGSFARYYMPFRWHREGGVVTTTLEGGDCAIGTAFAWRRAGVVVR